MAIDSAEEFVSLRLSADPRDYRRAAHEAASVGVWLDVIAQYPEMRKWVIRNKTVPIEILAQLSADPDPGVRRGVARKRSLSRELFEALAEDADESVRAQLAWNQKAPAYVLDRLQQDHSSFAREQVRNATAARA